MDHAASSSHGQPVIVLPNRFALDIVTWVTMKYQVEIATEAEWVELEKAWKYLMAHVTRRELEKLEKHEKLEKKGLL